jgi:hypothetical protein
MIAPIFIQNLAEIPDQLASGLFPVENVWNAQKTN